MTDMCNNDLLFMMGKVKVYMLSKKWTTQNYALLYLIETKLNKVHIFDARTDFWENLSKDVCNCGLLNTIFFSKNPIQSQKFLLRSTSKFQISTLHLQPYLDRIMKAEIFVCDIQYENHEKVLSLIFYYLKKMLIILC